MLNTTSAKGAHTMTTRLQMRPTVLRENGACMTCLRPLSSESRIGSAYAAMKAFTAVDTNELNAVELPRSMRHSSAWITKHRQIACGTLPPLVTRDQIAEPGTAWSREKENS